MMAMMKIFGEAVVTACTALQGSALSFAGR
jgi:hypothetical protein